MTDRALLDALRPLVDQLVEEKLAKLRPTAQPLLSTAQAAELAGVSLRTVRRWLADGTLTPRRAGRVLRIERAEFEAFLREPRRGTLSPEQLADRDFG